MTTTPTILKLQETIFIGIDSEMSGYNDHTNSLWSQFMPRRREVKPAIGIELFSLAVYPKDYFKNYDGNITYQKWAAVKSNESALVPSGMKRIIVPEGNYAKFTHRGPLENISQTFQFIFGEWLPKSKYGVDLRPHIAVMDNRYEPYDMNSEEDIFIPII